MISKELIRYLQLQLASYNTLNITFSGIIDNQTIIALKEYYKTRQDWNEERLIIAYIQEIALNLNIDSGPIDGWFGPQTEHAFHQLEYYIQHGRFEPYWRMENPLNYKPSRWPIETEGELNKFFGNAGSNIIKYQPPYAHFYSWNNERCPYIMCNKKVAASLDRVLERTLEYYTDEGIQRLGLNQFGGCFRIRNKRGGNLLSPHSWGAALDYLPQKNCLKWGKGEAIFSTKDYEAWMFFWDEEGWINMGQAMNYDYMHFQAAITGP